MVNYQYINKQVTIQQTFNVTVNWAYQLQACLSANLDHSLTVQALTPTWTSEKTIFLFVKAYQYTVYWLSIMVPIMLDPLIYFQTAK